MSALRTLKRRHNLAGSYVDEDGERQWRKRRRPGSLNRRILLEIRIGDYLHSLHAAKGVRRVRQPA